MKELSLFSGAGGGLLASKYFLNWKTMGYVEYEKYPQKVIAQRIKDGLLDEAPIFGDIRTFISEGYAESYSGMVDAVSGGFPCTPFSPAGRQRGKNDPKNMWPATCRVIEIVKPRYAFLENVPGLISCGYLGNVLQDLAEIGYNAKWTCLSSKDIGAPINRNRLWILAESIETRYVRHYIPKKKASWVKVWKRDRWPNFQNCKKDWLLANSYIIRKPNRVAEWMDRFAAIGNGQDPRLAATAFELLINS